MVVQDRETHADRGGDRLVARSGGTDVGDEVEDLAGHLSGRAGVVGGVLQQASQRAHRNGGAGHGGVDGGGGGGGGRGLLAGRSSRRCRGMRERGAGENSGEGVKVVECVGQSRAEVGAGAPGECEEIEEGFVDEESFEADAGRCMVPAGGRRGRRGEFVVQPEGGGAGLGQGGAGERAGPVRGRRGRGEAARVQEQRAERVEDCGDVGRPPGRVGADEPVQPRNVLGGLQVRGKRRGFCAGRVGFERAVRGGQLGQVLPVGDHGGPARYR
ncbi:hypothetical protein POF50_008415 [Streptomyces sp. SL13]|uniref:Uncharacterized protein n=1 Tax=Streptantibioticus silvisoli TaxID=2705255 RepID=A0AA90GWW0_9ACTN|nr:hypothetical protein [Streptantibioticus silvisoli]MDI5969369.1 hypothetical protein [Streptantibioticus silvisoli]